MEVLSRPARSLYVITGIFTVIKMTWVQITRLSAELAMGAFPLLPRSIGFFLEETPSHILSCFRITTKTDCV